MKNHTLLLLALVALSHGLYSTAYTQVTIPANSAKSLDDSSEVSSGPGAPVTSSAFSTKSSVSRVQPPTTAIPSQKASITSSTSPVKESRVEGSKVAAIQRVQPQSMPQSISTIKRLSELRRELRIAESSTRARITLPADELFEEINKAKIDRFAVPVLTKVAEYLRLTDKRKMTLTGHYLKDEEGGRSIAQNRTISLIQWLETSGGLPTNLVNSEPPVPLKAVSNTGATTTGSAAPPQNRLEINLEWEQVARAPE